MFKPVRKLTNSGTLKNTGVFPSKKNKRLVSFESLLELDYLHRIEFDKSVLSYCEQPIKIEFLHNGRRCSYTPDFYVEYATEDFLIEIKPEAKLKELFQNPDVLYKYKAASNYCLINNISKFRIVTDTKIRSGNILSNIHYLFPYSQIIVPLKTHDLIKTILCDHNQITIGDLCEKLKFFSIPDNISFSYIMSLIYNHYLNVDLSEPINRFTYLCL